MKLAAAIAYFICIGIGTIILALGIVGWFLNLIKLATAFSS